MTGLLAGHAGTGELSQLFIHRGQQGLIDGGFALTNGVEYEVHFTHEKAINFMGERPEAPAAQLLLARPEKTVPKSKKPPKKNQRDLSSQLLERHSSKVVLEGASYR